MQTTINYCTRSSLRRFSGAGARLESSRPISRRVLLGIDRGGSAAVFVAATLGGAQSFGSSGGGPFADPFGRWFRATGRKRDWSGRKKGTRRWPVDQAMGRRDGEFGFQDLTHTQMTEKLQNAGPRCQRCSEPPNRSAGPLQGER